jgi:hypothetical protein
MRPPAETRYRQLQRQVRVVAILKGAEDAGISPVPAADLHLLAYFTDALAPVWGLRIVEAQLLKRRSGPFSPSLQRDLDLLVGRRVVRASNLRHIRDQDKAWRLDARYSLDAATADAILGRAHEFPEQLDHLRFVREVVLAVSALGLRGILAASREDAAYGDDVISDGDMVDISGRPGRLNSTARVALRFGDLLGPDTLFAPSEMIHLYVRALYGRLKNAA